MRLRNVLVVTAYAFLTSYGLERPGWLGWLSIIWPIIILIPVFVVLVRTSKRAIDYITYSAVGFAAGCIGFGLALYQALPQPYRQMAFLSTMGMAAYSAAVLAVFVTALFLVINRRGGDVFAARAEPRGFSIGAAWLSLVALAVVAEAYVYGMGAKSCGGPGWGFYMIMISPVYIILRPVIAIVPVVVFCGGGLLPRFLKINPRVAVGSVALLAIAAALLGVVVTPVSEQACSAL